MLYDHGKFLYSYHATDPCNGLLLNAFDLVRLHAFGALDDEVEGEHRGNNLPSYRAMRELAQQDPAVVDQLNSERWNELQEDFKDPVDTGEAPAVAWMRKLSRSGNGSIEHTSANILHVLEHDPRLQGRISKDVVKGKCEISGL